MNFNKIDFDLQLIKQQELIDLHVQLRDALREKITNYTEDSPATQKIDRCDAKIRLWYIERKIEVETEAHRQLTERRDAQEKEIETNFNEALQRFTATFSRIENVIGRIGKARINPEMIALVDEIRRQYDAKFCEDGDTARVRERKAFAYAQLKMICEDLSKLAG